MVGGRLQLASGVVERRADTAKGFGIRALGRRPARDEVLDAARNERVQFFIGVSARCAPVQQRQLEEATDTRTAIE